MNGYLLKVFILVIKVLAMSWSFAIEVLSQNFCYPMSSSGGLKDPQPCYMVMENVPHLSFLPLTRI